ncbi:isochorismatase family protein [Dongia deserti]|uniref:isochorismatase family protein n=1 Tax=Dongia deserti TaxID=2268030 RepID=UPI000E64998E|nr:isochorismatase family protein [Dongia deserti]
MRQELSIDPKRAALILIDLQEEQRHDPYYVVPDLNGVLANARRLLDAARANGVRVVHVAYKRDFTAVPRRPFEPVTAEGRPTFSDVSSPLTAICSEVGPSVGETVIEKNDASAFCTGELEPLLRDSGVDWVIVAGVWTEACVAATVRDAIPRGFRVLLVKDACGSGTTAMHQAGILNLANRLNGGAITTAETACRLIAGEVGDVWVAEKQVPILFTFADAERHYDAL